MNNEYTHEQEAIDMEEYMIAKHANDCPKCDTPMSYKGETEEGIEHIYVCGECGTVTYKEVKINKSTCCDAKVTETGFCTECKDNC